MERGKIESAAYANQNDHLLTLKLASDHFIAFVD